MKVSTIGFIFALVFGLAVVTSAKTTRQILPTKPSQQLPQVLFSKEELLNASVFDPAFQKRTFNADDFSSFMSILTNTKATEAIVCILLLGSGILALRSMRRDSPLGPYVLQILGLTFILPVVVIVTTIMKVEAQAVMGLLGTIVGYIFGTSHGIAPREREVSPQDGSKPNNESQVTPKSGAPDYFVGGANVRTQSVISLLRSRCGCVR